MTPKALSGLDRHIDFLFSRVPVDHQLEVAYQTEQGMRRYRLPITTDSNVRIFEVLRVAIGRHNCYIGANPRYPDAESGDKKNISHVSTIPMDFDPVELERPVSASRYEEILYVGEQIRDAMGMPGMTVATGNGLQVLIPVDPPIDLDDSNRYLVEDGVEEFSGRIKGELMASGILTKYQLRMDSIHDLPRLIRLAGTVNVKGKGDRVAEIVSHVDGFIPSNTIFDLMGDMRPVQGGARTEVTEVLVVPGRVFALLASDAKLAEAWYGIRRDIADISGSGQDFALVSRLKTLGFGKQEAYAALQNSPGGKRIRTKGYMDHTVDKIYG